MAHLPPNHPKQLIEVNKNYTRVLYAIVFGVLVSILFVSCNQQKKVQRAIKTVIGNDTALAQVGKVWDRLYPNDTIKSPSKPDTVGGEVYLIHDSIPYPVPYNVVRFRKVDTTVSGVRVVIDTSGGIRLSIPKQKPLYITNPPVYVRYRKEENELSEKLSKANISLSNVNGQLTTTQKELKKYQLYLGGLVALILLVLLLKAIKFVKTLPKKSIKEIL